MLEDNAKLETKSVCSTPTDREKASFVLGMVRAFLAVGWPAHFNDHAKAQWQLCAVWANQMMTDRVINPAHARAVSELFDDELNTEI